MSLRGGGDIGSAVLHTALLANLFGEIHASAVMNIFYTDDELHKQAELLTKKVR